MDIKGIKQVVPVLMKHGIVPFLWGAQGVGKTETMKQIAKEMNVGFVHLHLATQEVGDLTGLLIKDDAKGTVKHARPEWFPTEETHPNGGIIFLDEFNRAHPDVLQCMFSFLTEGTIHTHKLPTKAKWTIVAAGNYQNNSFNVTDTSDAALLSRFCHIDFKPEVAEFINFAEDIGMDTVAGFIRDNPACLEVKGEEFDNKFITPDRRAFVKMIGMLEQESLGEYQFEIYTGCIGTAAASAFIAHKKKREKSVSINDVLKRYNAIRDRVIALSNVKKGGEVRFDVLNGAIDELLLKLDNKKDLLKEDITLSNVQMFLLDIPLELAMKAFSAMQGKEFAGKDKILNNKSYIDQLVKKA